MFYLIKPKNYLLKFTNFLVEIKSNFLFFLKILLGRLKIGLHPIFVDECGFSMNNTNFRNWVKTNSQYNAKLSFNNNKLNLIMAVSDNKIIHYTISEENTNTTKFLDFMNGLLNVLTEDEKKKQLLS